MNRWQRWWRRLRSVFWTALTLALVLAAVVVGLGQLLLPYTDLYQPRLERRLGAALGEPVSLDRLSGEWQGLKPRLDVSGMRLAESGSSVDALTLQLRLLNLFRPGHPVYHFEVRGMDITLQRNTDGSWSTLPDDGETGDQGVPDDGGTAQLLRRLSTVGELLLEDSRLRLRDPHSGMDIAVVIPNARIQSVSGRTALFGRVHLDRQPEAGSVRFNILAAPGDDQPTRWEIDAERLSLAPWAVSLAGPALDGTAVFSARGELMASALEAWLEISIDNGAVPVAGSGPAEAPLPVPVPEDVAGDGRQTASNSLSFDLDTSRFRLRYQAADQWRLDANPLSGTVGDNRVDIPRASVFRRGEFSGLSANHLDLSLLSPLARWMPPAVDGLPAALPTLLPTVLEGRVEDLDLVLDQNRRPRIIRAQVRGLGASAWPPAAGPGQQPAPWPEFSGVSGGVDFRHPRGQWSVVVEEGRWRQPPQAPEWVDLQHLRCDGSLRAAPQFRINTGDCSLSAAGGEAALRLDMLFNEGLPYVDGLLTAERIVIERLAPYWAVGGLSEDTVDWLQDALVGGTVLRAQVGLLGDLDDWPFAAPAAAGDTGSADSLPPELPPELPDETPAESEWRPRPQAASWAGPGLELQATVQDAELRYAPDWPPVSEIGAQVTMRNRYLLVTAGPVRTAELTADGARAEIADLSQAELVLEAAGDVTVPGIVDFLRRAPILDEADEVLTRLKTEGAAAVSVDLVLPLGDESWNDDSLDGDDASTEENDGPPPGFSLSGTARPQLASVSDPVSGYTLTDLEGEVAFTHERVQAEGLSARLAGHELRVDWEIQPQAADFLTLQAQGDLPPAALTGEQVSWTPEMAALADGSSDWRIVLSASEGGEGEVSLGIRASSDLLGTALYLPAPLDKLAVTGLPTTLEWRQRGQGDLVSVSVGDRLQGVATLDPQNWRPISLKLGLGEPAVLPTAPRYAIHGDTGDLNLDGWLALAATAGVPINRPAGVAVPIDVAVRADRLQLANRVLPDTLLEAAKDGPEWDIWLAGPAVTGQITLPAGNLRQSHVTAEFSRMNLPEALPGDGGEGLDPRSLPALHLLIRDLTYGQISLDEFRLEAFPVAEGLRFEQVDGSAAGFSFRADGRWHREEQTDGQREEQNEADAGRPADISDFDLYLTTEDLGGLLSTLGISAPLEGGQSIIQVNAAWPGEPADFALAQLDGSLEADIGPGRLLNAEPGAGRLLGLISLSAIPRRLALDFRDIFDEGFSFDRATGRFELNRGQASTDDFTVEAQTARILVSGLTDLAARRYDQVITVEPGLGQTLPVIGALAAGPGGAAAGLALQGLLQRRLGQAMAARYSVTGSWEEPVVRTVGDAGSAGDE